MKRVVIVVYDGVLLLDVAGPADVFDTVARHTHAEGYDIDYVSLDGPRVTASGGLRLEATPYEHFNLSGVHTLIIPGSDKIQALVQRTAVIAWIRQAADRVARLCTVCTGSILLARAGLLNHKAAACHWRAADAMQRYYPQVSVDVDCIYVRSDNIWTSAGGSAGIDLCLALVRQDYGDQVMQQVARHLVVYIHRAGSQRQFSSLLESQSSVSASMTDLIQWMQSHVCEIPNVETIATHCGMSLRNFHRRFVREVGKTPAKYLEALRVEAAAALLQTGNQPLKAIAFRTGFNQELRLIKAFQRHFQLTPTEYRRLHTIPLAADV